MGFRAYRETIRHFLHEPRNYDFIQQHYFLTGILFATRFDENAIRTLCEKCWQIDDVTGERIRFLFCIEDKSDAQGRSHPAKFLQSMDELGMQSELLDKEWARAQARELGISSYLPCLLWVRHDQADRFYVDPLGNAQTDDIYVRIRKISDHFNDKNTQILSEIKTIEQFVDISLRGLQISLTSLKSEAKITAAQQQALKIQDRLFEILASETPQPKAVIECLAPLLTAGDSRYKNSPVIRKQNFKLRAMLADVKRLTAIFDETRHFSNKAEDQFHRQLRDAFSSQQDKNQHAAISLCSFPRALLTTAEMILSAYLPCAEGVHGELVASQLERLRGILTQSPSDPIPLDANLLHLLLEIFGASAPVRRASISDAPSEQAAPALSRLAAAIRDGVLSCLRQLHVRLWRLYASETIAEFSLSNHIFFQGALLCAMNDLVPSNCSPDSWWQKQVLEPYKQIEILITKLDWKWMRGLSLQQVESRLISRSLPRVHPGRSSPIVDEVFRAHLKASQLPVRQVASSIMELCPQALLEQHIPATIEGAVMEGRVMKWLLDWFPIPSDTRAISCAEPFLNALGSERRAHLIARIEGSGGADGEEVDTPTACKRIKAALGLLSPERPIGMNAFRQQFLRLQQESEGISLDRDGTLDWQIRTRGLGTTVGVTLEDMLRRIVVAYSAVAGITREALSKKLQSAAIGPLCEMLAEYPGAPTSDISPNVQPYYGTFLNLREKFLRLVRSLAAERNVFPHSRAGERTKPLVSSQMLLSSLRKLLAGCLEALETISPAFPITVRPRSMEITPAYGNLWKMEADPTGEEVVLLEPSMTLSGDRDYFMFPQTNSIRMYPVLVEFSLAVAS